MITVEKRPAPISFAGNPLRYTVISDGQYSNYGNPAIVELNFTGVDNTIGHHFHLSFMNMILDFVISSGDNESGLEIPPSVSGDTAITWCAKVAAAMSVNYYLHTYYDMYVVSDKIGFISKQRNAFYTITFTNVDISGISLYHHQTGMNIQTYPGFGILAQVLDENDQVIGEDFRPVDADGRTHFDISEYINACLEGFTPPHFTIPATGDHLKCFTDGVKLYRVAFCEQYNQVSKRIFVDEYRRAMMGGLSREALVYWNDSDPFWGSANNLQRFLTWCPSGKLTTKKQLERLFFFTNTNDELILNYTVFYSDTSSASGSLSPFSVNEYSILEVQVGYDDLDLDSIYPLNVVTGWSVYLTDGSAIVSEVYHFILDQRYKEFDRQFLFRNSFGWYDVMRLTGKIEKTLNHDRTEGYTISEDPETDFNAPDKNFINFETQSFKGTTGWVSKEAQNWLRDFLISREIYEIIAGRFYPIKLTSKKSVLGKDGEDNLMLDFEYIRAYRDVFFSINPAATVKGQPNRNYCNSYGPSYS